MIRLFKLIPILITFNLISCVPQKIDDDIKNIESEPESVFQEFLNYVLNIDSIVLGYLILLYFLLYMTYHLVKSGKSTTFIQIFKSFKIEKKWDNLFNLIILFCKCILVFLWWYIFIFLVLRIISETFYLHIDSNSDLMILLKNKVSLDELTFGSIMFLFFGTVGLRGVIEDKFSFLSNENYLGKFTGLISRILPFILFSIFIYSSLFYLINFKFLN